MKKIFNLLFFYLLAGSVATSQGKVSESNVMKSKILDKDVKYSVYLPSDYEKSNRSYPVFYLLHGYTDNETAWVQFGEVNTAADIEIAKREVPPMIIVMPDAGLTWYINDYQGKVQYEDMFFNELIPFIEKTYRTRPLKEFRAIGGLSMGGYGSLIYAMKHPDMFCACVAMSAAVFGDTVFIDRIRKAKNNLVEVYGPMVGDTLPLNWKKNNVLGMINEMPPDKLTSVKYYIDCGDKDFLIAGNCALHLSLMARKVPHEFRVRDGEHNWTYWRASVVDGMKFIGQYFHR